MKLKQNGFTLLEMMIVVVILCMLVSGIYIAFRAGGDVWTSSEARMQRYQNARCIIELMQIEVGSLFFNNTLSSNFPNGYKCNGGNDYFYFFTRLQPISDTNIDDDSDGSIADTSSDLCKVGYVVNNNEIIRYFDRGPISSSFPGDFSNILADCIVSITFKYWDNEIDIGNDLPNWSNKGVSSWPESKTYKPQAVLIELTVTDNITSYQQKFSTAIYIP